MFYPTIQRHTYSLCRENIHLHSFQLESRKYLHHKESTPGLDVLEYNYHDKVMHVLHVIVFILFAVRRTVITHTYKSVQFQQRRSVCAALLTLPQKETLFIYRFQTGDCVTTQQQKLTSKKINSEL